MTITVCTKELCKWHIYPSETDIRVLIRILYGKAHSKSQIETYAISPISGETLCKTDLLITSSETRTKLTVKTQGF